MNKAFFLEAARALLCLLGCFWLLLLCGYVAVQLVRFLCLPHPHEGAPLLVAP